MSGTVPLEDGRGVPVRRSPPPVPGRLGLERLPDDTTVHVHARPPRGLVSGIDPDRPGSRSRKGYLESRRGRRTSGSPE